MMSHPFAYKRLSRQPGVKTRGNVKSRLIKLVLLPLWYGNKDIIRDNLSGRHIVENFDIVSIQHYPQACQDLCLTHGTAAGNSRVSAGYYEFYYISLRWYFRTNEHIAKAAKRL